MGRFTDSLVGGMNKEECQALATGASLPEVANDVHQDSLVINLEDDGV